MPKLEETSNEELESQLQAYVARLSHKDTGQLQRLQTELDAHQVILELQARQLRETQAALENSRDRYAGLYDFSPIALLSLDSAGVIREVNVTATKLLGKRGAQLIGMPLADCVERGERRKLIHHLFQSRKLQFARCEVILDGDNGATPVEVYTAHEQDGEHTRYRIALSDISELKRIETNTERRVLERTIELEGLNRDLFEALKQNEHLTGQLKAHADQLSATYKAKDEFIAMISHELRNPLSPITDGLEALEKMLPHEPTTDAVYSRVKRQVNQLRFLVDDLLDVNRVRTGKVRMHKRAVDLKTLCRTACDSARTAAEEKGQELRFDACAETPVVNGDEGRLLQIVANLLNNAIKYTDPGGKVELTLCKEGQYVAIQVRDNGIGIAPDRLQHIFEMFAQEETSLHQAKAGLGIGLALVKQFTELHDGIVEAYSAGLGQGSEFTVVLPSLDQNHSVSEPEPEVYTLKEGETPIDKKVLIVDDNEDSAECTAILLRQWGNEVHTAYNGTEAFKLAADTKPDVVLLDINLPDMHGADLAKRLRDLPGLEQVSIIALTGDYGGLDVDQKTSAGFTEYLVKPVDPGHIRTLLARSA